MITLFLGFFFFLLCCNSTRSPSRCGVLLVVLTSVAAPLKQTLVHQPQRLFSERKPAFPQTPLQSVLVECWGHWEKSECKMFTIPVGILSCLLFFFFFFFAMWPWCLVQFDGINVEETTAFAMNLAFLGCFSGGSVTYKCISNICLRSTFQRPLFSRKWSACMQGHEPPSPSHQCRLSHTYLPVKSFIPLITGQWLYQQLHQVFFYMLFTQIIWIIVYVDFGASLM